MDGFALKWGWVDCVMAVVDVTRERMSEVWRMNIVEFLNLLCYIKDRNEHQKQMMEKWKKEN